MLYAIDVSHHQNPSALDWAGMRQAGCDLCIVRLTYGTKKDERAKEHIERARDNGFQVGAYMFGRTVERVTDQYVAFAEAADAAGYGRPEDICPALDVEDDTAARPIKPSHAELFETLALYLKNWRGAIPYVYITQRDWTRIGSPKWVLGMPLFVAHYAAPTRLEPATPNGMPWDIWQHRVGPFVMEGPSGYDKEHPLLDQSRVRALNFLNGERMTFEDEHDEEIRRLVDDDGTDDIRAERHDAFVRAYAQELASESTAELIEADRERAMRRQLDTLDDEPLSDVEPEGRDT